MLRWMAEITYRTDREPDVVTFEEIGTPRLPRLSGTKELIKAGMPPEEAMAIYDELRRQILASRRQPNLHDLIEGGIDGKGGDWHDIDQIVITLNRPVLQPEPEPEPKRVRA